MCELLGFTSAEPEDIGEQLREFFSHSERNPHGWGLFSEGEAVRGCEQASQSKTLKWILRDFPPQTQMLGHIRFATVGTIKAENCHPFTAEDITGRRWTLIHNGTIYSGSRLIPYLRQQRGDTDSERLFLHLMSIVDEAQRSGALPAEKRFRLLEGFVRDMSPRNKLNLMICDGELLYVHKNMKETMVYRKLGSGYIFSTTPLDKELWKDIPTAQLIAYKNGECAFSGEPHDGIFVPTLQYISALDAMNI